MVNRVEEELDVQACVNLKWGRARLRGVGIGWLDGTWGLVYVQ